MSIVCIGKPGVKYDSHAAVYLATPGMEEQLVKRLSFADEVHIWDYSNEFWLGLVYFSAMLDQRTRRQQRIRLMTACGRKWARLFQALHDRCLTCGGEGRVQHWYAQDELGWRDCPDCKPVPIDLGSAADDAQMKPPKQFVPPCGSGAGPCGDCAWDERCDRLRAEHNENLST